MQLYHSIRSFQERSDRRVTDSQLWYFVWKFQWFLIKRNRRFQCPMLSLACINLKVNYVTKSLVFKTRFDFSTSLKFSLLKFKWYQWNTAQKKEMKYNTFYNTYSYKECILKQHFEDSNMSICQYIKKFAYTK